MKFLHRGMKMLIVSSYPPRKCGIATFSNDILNSVTSMFGNTLPIEICALQNDKTLYKYDGKVSYTLSTSQLQDYRNVAEKINERDDIGLVCVQHEFGLFGGDYGNYLLAFLLALNKPIATVFHSVLSKPNEKIKNVVQVIASLSDRIIVLTKYSKDVLIKEYGYQESKITIIEHGTHIVLWKQKEMLKKKYHYSNNIVLSTFGLISENKSIETALYALPKIVEINPRVIYLVIGKTHPEILKREGETYRNKLIAIVQKLKLEKNVVFINEYLDLDQLLEYLTLSDIYLFTSKDPNQAVSGTLAYAMGCGCAVISNPIPHAAEILDGSNGILLDEFENSKGFQKAIQKLIENNEERIAMAKKAFSMTRATAWENIAIKYGLLFGELTNRTEDLRFTLPPINLNHIEALTTEFGILQFSKFSQPDNDSGYTLDDNVRALINMVMYYVQFKDPKALKLASTYLTFTEEIQRKDGWFDNYKDFDLQLTKQNLEVNLEDANGRALWSLGYLISHRNIIPSTLMFQAVKCWDKAIKKTETITSPRAIAYAIKGLYHYYLVYKGEEIKNKINRFAEILLNHYNINSDDSWFWYEDYMTYANNILPEAMMYSYLVTNNKQFKKIAIISFDFLLAHYFMKGQIKVISNRGWFKKKNERAFYGEQPMEIGTTIVALDLFFEVTGNNKYKDQLELAFSWFLGNNHLKQIMYNPQNGASYDGLEDRNVNINQGSESSLCFLKTQMIMEKYLANPENEALYKNLETSHNTINRRVKSRISFLKT